MSIGTIYGFLTDEALHVKSPTVIKHSDINVGVGYLDDYTINYFQTPKAITDSRTNRLLVQGAGHVMLGDMIFHYDKERIAANLWDDVAASVFQQLFNIIEAAAYGQYDLDADLNALFNLQTSTYGIYQDGTLERSMTYKETQVRMDNGSFENLKIRHWVAFEIKTSPGAQSIPFKVWLSDTEFKIDYPYTTITKVVPPCEPSKLVDPNFHNIVDTLSRSAIYMNQIIGIEVKNQDHNGMLMYLTAYNSSQYVTRYEFPFGLLYKGPEPSSQVARMAVRDYLLNLRKSDDTLLASEAVWRSLFPELFIHAQFFIIPRWNETFVPVPNGPTLDRSISGYKEIMTKMLEIFTWLPEPHVKEYTEIFYTKTSKFLLVSVPHPDNETIMAISEEHPTYMAIDSTSQFFDYMDDKTKDFTSKLNACIASLKGSTNPYSFLSHTIHGREYLSFATNFVEYHVLKPTFF